MTFCKPLEKSRIRKILVISLSNFGDVILTFPVLDILKKDFPGSKISVVVSPKAKVLLEQNPHFDKVFIFDKHQSVFKTLSWLGQLRREKFDLVIDLRNTAIPLFLWPIRRTPMRLGNISDGHMKQKHLKRLKQVYNFESESLEKFSLFISPEDKKVVNDLLEKEIGLSKKFAVIAPGAANHLKRFSEKGFAQIADYLASQGQMKIVFAGDESDKNIAQRIIELMNNQAFNLCGRLTLIQLGELLKHAKLAVVNDSGPMHLASYVDVPVVAIFGPSDPGKYGPWGRQAKFFKHSGDYEKCVHAVVRCIEIDENGKVSFRS